MACCLILTFTSARVYEPYFPSHPERNAYITLLQKKDPPASDALLKSALVRRAIADVQRLLRIREDKPALQNLLQKGSIGDDLWNSLLSAEKELEAEIMEVVSEANSFAQGWGQVIFPTANEMLANEKIRAIYERTAETKAELGMEKESFAVAIVTLLTTYSEEKYDIRPKISSDTLSKPTNGLLSAPHPGLEGVPSSEGEGEGPATGSGTPKSVCFPHLSYYHDLTTNAGQEREEKKVAKFYRIPIFSIHVKGS